MPLNPFHLMLDPKDLLLRRYACIIHNIIRSCGNGNRSCAASSRQILFYFLRPVDDRSVDLDMLRVKPPIYSWRSLLFFSNLLKSDCTFSHLSTRASRLDWTCIA